MAGTFICLRPEFRRGGEESREGGYIPLYIIIRRNLRAYGILFDMIYIYILLVVIFGFVIVVRIAFLSVCLFLFRCLVLNIAVGGRQMFLVINIIISIINLHYIASFLH